MRKTLQHSLLLAATMIGFSVYSNTPVAEGVFYLAPQISHSELNIDSSFLPSGFDEDVRVQGTHVSFGYRTHFNLVLEGGAGYAENLNSLGSTFDNYELTSLRAAVGVSLPISNSFRIVPMAGAYRWRLRGKEGQFSNPGNEDKITSKNTEHFWEMNAEYLFSDNVGLDFSLSNIDTEFGRIKTARVGFKFEFH